MPRLRLLKIHPLLTRLLIALSLTSTLNGCQPEAPQKEAGILTTAVPAQTVDLELTQVTNGAWHLASLELQETLIQAQRLHQSINLLLAGPSELTLSDAREQWHKTHRTLQQLAPFFSLGEINPGLLGQLDDSRFQLDAWPIQAGYLDYFDVYSHSGLVNDIAVPMTAATLRSQHGFSDNNDISIGLHAMAYLLWGEEKQRPIGDLKASIALSTSQKQSGMSIVDLPSNRRRTLLKLHSNLLPDDLEALLYRMKHSASAVSIAYHSLSPEARLLLWRQTLQHVLADDLLATQLAPKRSPSTDFIEHNQFSGRRASALSHSMAGVERLPWHKAEGHDRALIDWIVEAEDRAPLRLQFQQLQQQLSHLDEQWQDLPAATHAQLLQQLQLIIEQLRPA